MIKLTATTNWEYIEIKGDDGEEYHAKDIKALFIDGKHYPVMRIGRVERSVIEMGVAQTGVSYLPVIEIETEIDKLQVTCDIAFFKAFDVYLSNKPYPIYS